MRVTRSRQPLRGALCAALTCLLSAANPAPSKNGWVKCRPLYRKKTMAIYPDLGVLSPSSNHRLFECIENKFKALCWFLLPQIITPTKPCELHFEISPLFVLSVSIHPEPDANMEIGKLQASVNEVLLMALREVSEYLYSLDGE